jgi:23S rRNA (cytosine1962-C5)-methyltransferase
VLPCLIFEDEHLLVVNKPPGLNTHAPAPFAGEGIYEWLRHREPRWAGLAIIHRLDKETSGVMVFGKTAVANRSLTDQFTTHSIRKIYRLLAGTPPPQENFTADSTIFRAGNKYVSDPAGKTGERAVTEFTSLGREDAGRFLLEARPLTGRTHQIRAQAAAAGFPIIGDVLYGGSRAQRVCLHARQLTLQHPVTHEEMNFTVPEDFAANASLALRAALVDPVETNACRLIHGAADGWPGWHVERRGEFLLSEAETPLRAAQEQELRRLLGACSARGAYHKILPRELRCTVPAEASPRLILGEAAFDHFVVRENALYLELSFAEGGSTGLFLDQRDNRRRILANHVARNFPLFPDGPAGAEVLNVFAYTCAFSVCAAQAGARATSLDLSRKYLDWGRRNFALNQLDPARHDFIYGDAFDWMRRLAKKGRAFDLVILDPPTYSQSKQHGAFRAEKDFGRLVGAALPVLKSGGVLFASTNAARLAPEDFLETIDAAIEASGREILQQHYVSQPADFPIHRLEPAYLKTVWLRVA